MDSNGVAMQVIADNISNLHTSGFKSTSVQFEDVLGMSLEGISGTNRLGVGAKVSSMNPNFIQGTMMTTGIGTDVAINGKGFFIVENTTNNEEYYTRSGHFYMDQYGYYVNPSGFRVQGYLYDSTGTNLIETLSDIQVDRSTMVAPSATAAVDMVLNLDSAETTATFDITAPGTTSHYSTATTIYDSLGQSHTIQVYFTKTANQTWQWNATIDGSDVNGGTAGVLELFGTGTLAFDDTGELQTVMPVDFYTTGGITFANGIDATDIDLDVTGTTQYGANSAIQSISQDGYAAGSISGVGLTEAGKIVGYYTNGVVKNIAQLALADFTNLYGLERAGSMLYKATTSSGAPLVNKPGVNGLGNVSPSMLEESNVDLAAEFIKMIITQRGYQANSKIISTTDEMLAQLISIK